MCTAISILANDHYFGRNLDLHESYSEAVAIMPRNYPLSFRCTATVKNHYAMIGMATLDQGHPLFYDATNEHGLSIAALNFPDNAVYLPTSDSAVNIAPFEFIPWLLCQCKTTTEAKELLENVRIVDIPFSEKYPQTPLHWILSDRDHSIVIEPTRDSLMIYDNPVGVLTNNPPFPYHSENIRHYVHLSNREPSHSLFKDNPVSNGTGAVGLPGDFTSVSRFIRAAFLKEAASFGGCDQTNVPQFFHILQSVQQVQGAVKNQGQLHYTVYSSCCNATKRLYYYTTYENSSIHCIDMHKEDLDSNITVSYPIRSTPEIVPIN